MIPSIKTNPSCFGNDEEVVTRRSTSTPGQLSLRQKKIDTVLSRITKDNSLNCPSETLVFVAFCPRQLLLLPWSDKRMQEKAAEQKGRKLEAKEKQAEKQSKARNAGNGPLVSWRVFNATDSRRSDGNPTEWVHIDPSSLPFFTPFFPRETASRRVANDGCTFTIVFTLLEWGQGGVMINFPCTN